jgi:predicted DsbA family dithiol-disulfide isomerase
MSNDQSPKADQPTPDSREAGTLSFPVAITGFALCFLSGAGVMWGIDSHRPQTGASTTDTTQAAAGKPANPGAVRVDLHVMSQCPYGVQAENAFKEVVSKFGPDLDLHVEFIGQTDPSGAPSSMHGPNEVKGDITQVCVQKYAPTKAFDFILCQDENSKEVGTNGASCAQKLGIPFDKIGACADGQEGKDLLLASFKRSKDKGAGGSPTFYIGGSHYEGGRKPRDLMKAICNAATSKKPAACSDIPESPKVNVTILSDNRCGPDCDPKRVEGQIRGNVGAPVVTNLDYTSADGKRLYDQIKPVSLPAAVFDSTLDADKEAVTSLRGLKPAGSYKVMGMGGWNPACADDGGCKLDDCKNTMQCRVEEPKKLDVFVMAQCPYGVKGLDATKEVFENFKKAGDPIDFAIHYIGDGDASNLSSMHGAGEVAEDLREACVMKHYPKNLKYMDYIWCRDKNIRDANWESCTGGTTGFDTDTVKKCSEGDEGKQLVAKSFADSKATGIGASPTWLANNRFKFSGIDAQTIKTNLCAHNAKLKGCDATLSGAAAPKPGGAKEPGCGG